MAFLMFCSLHLHQHIIFICCAGWYTVPYIQISWRSITSNRFVLNMVKGCYLQLRASGLWCSAYFYQFSIRTASAYHPVIQKEVQEYLAKRAVEPSTDGAGFYSNVFVVLTCLGSVCPNLNCKWFNCYMHIPSFRMPTIKQVCPLIQQGDYALSIDLKDASMHVHIVKQHHHLLQFVLQNKSYQWKVLPFGLSTAPRVFTSLTKPILFLCHCKGFYIIICLDDILMLVCSKYAGKTAWSFLCPLWLHHGLQIGSMSEIHLN